MDWASKPHSGSDQSQGEKMRKVFRKSLAFPALAVLVMALLFPNTLPIDPDVHGHGSNTTTSSTR
jgi:hypothetical protein